MNHFTTTNFTSQALVDHTVRYAPNKFSSVDLWRILKNKKTIRRSRFVRI